MEPLSFRIGLGADLVPGLIDSHVHVGIPPGVGVVTEDFTRRHEAMLAAYWRQLSRSSYLYHGVTAVADLASPPGSAERFRSAPRAPDLVPHHGIRRTKPTDSPQVL